MWSYGQETTEVKPMKIQFLTIISKIFYMIDTIVTRLNRSSQFAPYCRQQFLLIICSYGWGGYGVQGGWVERWEEGYRSLAKSWNLNE